MATVSEKFRGASGDLTSHSITYIVKEADDDIDALQAVDAAAPATYDGLTKDNFRYEEVRWPDLWEVTVEYTKKTRQPPDTGSSEYAFDVGLETQRVLQGYSTVQKYTSAGAGTGENFYGAINVDSVTREAQGVDVRVPTGSFVVSYYPAVAVVTSAYQKTILELVGKVNNATFYGHAAGEVLFVGASGKARNATDWELSFRFEVRPNQTGLTIGDITGVAVDGWDLLWVYYEPDVSSTKFIRKPVQVNVERVYERADFSVIGV